MRSLGRSRSTESSTSSAGVVACCPTWHVMFESKSQADRCADGEGGRDRITDLPKITLIVPKSFLSSGGADVVGG